MSDLAIRKELIAGILTQAEDMRKVLKLLPHVDVVVDIPKALHDKLTEEDRQVLWITHNIWTQETTWPR